MVVRWLERRILSENRDNGERLKVLPSLTKQDALWTQNVLLDALADSNEEIRNYIVQQLSQKENLDLNLLYIRLSKPPWFIKTEILKILGILKNPRSAQHIEAVLNESNDEGLKTAAEKSLNGISTLKLL